MILFRTNAGPQVGFGHLTRCRALAMALRRAGKRCVMVGPDSAHAKPEDDSIFDEWVPVSSWSSSQKDALNTIEIAQRHQADWLVLDDYRIDEAYQLALKAAGLRWLQFDGTANQLLWADIVLNANAGARLEDYQTVLRNPNARLLLGPRYAIMRPEFDQIMRQEPGHAVKNVLLTFGGGCDRGANQFVLSKLLPLTAPCLRFVVVSGARNPNNCKIKRWIEANGEGRVTLHLEPDLVSPLFASCQLAVTAGGTTTAELAALGIPFVTVAVAVNQKAQCEAWEYHGISLHAGSLICESISERIEAHFKRLLTNPHERFERSRLAIKFSDGRGAYRVLQCLKKKFEYEI